MGIVILKKKDSGVYLYDRTIVGDGMKTGAAAE